MVPSIYGENMFDEFFDNNGFFGSHSPLFGKNSKNLMKTDIRETDDAKAYHFAVELPGFKKEDINIDIDKDCLTISAERKSEEKEDKGDNGFVRRERYYGSFSRSFNIKGIDTDGITAEYNDGVLTLTMPEKTPEVPAARRLEIK